jgi:hypothetical protein
MGQRCTPQRVAALRWVWDRTSCTLAPCGATAQSLTWGSATDNIRSAAKYRVRSRQRGDRPRYSLAPRSHPCTARFPARVDGNIPGFARIQQAQLRREHLVALRVRTHRTQRRDSVAGRSIADSFASQLEVEGGVDQEKTARALHAAGAGCEIRLRHRDRAPAQLSEYILRFMTLCVDAIEYAPSIMLSRGPMIANVTSAAPSPLAGSTVADAAASTAQEEFRDRKETHDDMHARRCQSMARATAISKNEPALSSLSSATENSPGRSDACEHQTPRASSGESPLMRANWTNQSKHLILRRKRYTPQMQPRLSGISEAGPNPT